MSEWINRIKSHPIFARLENIETTLFTLIDDAQINPEMAIDIARIKNVLAFLSNRLQSIPAEILTPHILSTLDQPLREIEPELINFLSNKNRNHLVNINSKLDTLLSSAYTLPEYYIRKKAAVIKESIESLQTTSEGVLRNITEKNNKIEEQLKQLRTVLEQINQEINNQKSRLDIAISDYQQQFSQAENLRRDQFNQNTKSRDDKFEKVIDDFKKTIEENLSVLKQKIENSTKSSEVKINKLADDMRDDAQNIIADLEQSRGKAQNLLHVIGSTGMAGEYQKVADRANTKSLIWQIIAGLSMIGLIVFAIWAYITTQSKEIIWGALGAKVFVTITFGVLAAYAARQADRYFDLETLNRSFQVELSSIDPYLANLPEENQRQVKLDLSQKLFGRIEKQNMDMEKVTGNTSDLFVMLLDNIKELIKKIR